MVSHYTCRGVVSYYYTVNRHTSKNMKLTKGYTSTGKKVYYMKKNLYDEDGKMIKGNWKLCKDIVLEYDATHPYEHYKVKKATVKRLAKKYDISVEDVVRNVKILSGIAL